MFRVHSRLRTSFAACVMLVSLVACDSSNATDAHVTVPRGANVRVAAESLAKATGGVRLSFARRKKLETVVQSVGDDLHQQYLISFTPGEGKPGYRPLQVRVKSHPELIVRTRPGYQISP